MSEQSQTAEPVKAGVYKGRAVKGSEQYGKTSGGTDQIVLDLAIKELGRNLQTFLYFSEKSAPYSIERLRKCGWKTDDILDLTGIDENEIDVEVLYEMYQPPDGSPARTVMKVNIIAVGRVQIDQFSDADKRAFRARVSAMMGKKPDPAFSGTQFPLGANAPPPAPPAPAPVTSPNPKAGF